MPAPVAPRLALVARTVAHGGVTGDTDAVTGDAATGAAVRGRPFEAAVPAGEYPGRWAYGLRQIRDAALAGGHPPAGPRALIDDSGRLARVLPVLGDVHFVKTHHSWTCAAAPILDPVTGELLDAAARMAESFLRDEHHAARVALPQVRDSDHIWRPALGSCRLVPVPGRPRPRRPSPHPRCPPGHRLMRSFRPASHRRQGVLDDQHD